MMLCPGRIPRASRDVLGQADIVQESHLGT